MDRVQPEEPAKAQHESLCNTVKALRRHAKRSSRIRDIRLQPLGVVKAAPLDIDEQAPCDFEPRFFSPNYADEHLSHALGGGNPEYITGLVETGLQREGIWGDTFDRKDPDDSEWLEPTPDQLPAFRLSWFASCLKNMLQVNLDNEIWWEDEEEQQQHESRTDGWRVASDTIRMGDSTFRMPRREEMDWDYRCLALLQPRDPAKPHLGVIMGDSKVPRKADEMLVSELHAAAEISKRQLSCGDFTNHHTKPIIIYTLMSETHARITQAHFDAKADKLVVRQSRILDLKGERPTADAYLLLRWMMNTPVGETEYKQEDAGGDKVEGGCLRRVPSQPSLVTAEAG